MSQLLNSTNPDQSSYLSPAFVARLQKAALQYQKIEKARSGKQWMFAQMTLEEWDKLDDEIKDEVGILGHYTECSYWINRANGMHIVSDSGQTLRRWCDVWKPSHAIPAFSELSEVLYFDHFFQARQLANKELAAMDEALAVAYNEHLTADEMAERFDPTRHAGVSEYDRVVGWLDSLQTTKFEWLEPDDRRRAGLLLKELRGLVEIRP